MVHNRGQKKEKCVKGFRQWTTGSTIQWFLREGTREVSPTTIPASYLQRVSRLPHRGGPQAEPSPAVSLWRPSPESGRPRRSEFPGKSTREGSGRRESWGPRRGFGSSVLFTTCRWGNYWGWGENQQKAANRTILRADTGWEKPMFPPNGLLQKTLKYMRCLV